MPKQTILWQRIERLSVAIAGIGRMDDCCRSVTVSDAGDRLDTRRGERGRKPGEASARDGDVETPTDRFHLGCTERWRRVEPVWFVFRRHQSFKARPDPAVRRCR